MLNPCKISSHPIHSVKSSHKSIRIFDIKIKRTIAGDMTLTGVHLLQEFFYQSGSYISTVLLSESADFFILGTGLINRTDFQEVTVVIIYLYFHSVSNLMTF